MPDCASARFTPPAAAARYHYHRHRAECWRLPQRNDAGRCRGRLLHLNARQTQRLAMSSTAATSYQLLYADDEQIALAFKKYFQTVLGTGITVYTDFDFKANADGTPILDGNGNLQPIDLTDQCVRVAYTNTGATGHLQTPNITGTLAPNGEEDFFHGTLSATI